MSALVQDLAVSLIALGAAAAIVRRTVMMFAAKPGAPGCSSCASGCAARATRPPDGSEERRIIRPLVIHATSTATATARSAAGHRVTT
jgi:hypothetical protein